jgi:hypothetical protein
VGHGIDPPLVRQGRAKQLRGCAMGRPRAEVLTSGWKPLFVELRLEMRGDMIDERELPLEPSSHLVDGLEREQCHMRKVSVSEQSRLVLDALDRLADGRLAGRVSAMMTIGNSALSLGVARQWADRNGTELSLWRGGGLGAAFESIGAAISRRPSSKQAALARLLPTVEGSAEATWGSLGATQRARLLEATFPAGTEREALTRLVEPVDREGDSFWSEERFAALMRIVPDNPLCLLFCWSEPFELSALSWVGSFLDAAPTTLLVIAAESQSQAALDAALRAGDRTAALIGELVVVPPNDVGDIGQEGAEPDVHALRLEVVEELRSGKLRPQGIYDSAAEAFLAQVLETHPATARLFMPQGRPGFAMAGGQAARVDFLATTPRIAIEVDGPHHLEAVQYRRDRHKDIELQARGYVVLRFLAEDIVADVERVRQTVIRVVQARRRRTPEFPV